MPPYILCDAAVDLVLRNEGLNQPGEWPGGASGITLGYGYDLGYISQQRFLADWGSILFVSEMRRLNRAVGKVGKEAAEVAPQFKEIHITKSQALEIFLARSVPRYWGMTCVAFPRVALLPSHVQGALFSLVYNRGGSMTGERRREMRAIQKAVASKDTEEIARQIRSMKRLWIGQGLDGLLTRREEEACLVEMA